jgi:cytidylate kinase
MSVITISREFGSGGSVIAKKAAQALGYHLVTKDTIARVLNQYGLAEFKEEYDAAPPGFWARFDTEKMERREVMVSLLNQTFLALARHGNMVIVGRCGFAVLGGYTNVLNVRIQAPLPVRVKRVMEEQNLPDAGQAEAMVKEADRIRATFVEAHYGGRWDAAGAFNVVVDTDKVPADLATAWLVEATGALKERIQRGEGHTAGAIQADSTLLTAVSYELDCQTAHGD